ncbi:MAG: hypothetical protein PHV37_06810 [Candidatus Gastranaerophilales bacterium]|nr:hypothetical protein [Candidatus Gastranaerophilales bacterium]
MEADNINFSDSVSPKTVRDALGIDNSAIQELCKKASVKPKRDSRGLTYFTKDDFNMMKDAIEKTKNLQSKLAMMRAERKTQVVATNKIDDASMTKLISSLKNIETAITEKVSSIMDEKLDGMDDVVLELIRCKTENETLRYKMNELNKENYNLKNELSSYKNVALNVYIKKA